jgi:hypothetical protein
MKFRLKEATQIKEEALSKSTQLAIQMQNQRMELDKLKIQLDVLKNQKGGAESSLSAEVLVIENT